VIAAIAAVVFAAGYFSCWISIHAAADARVDRVINTEPYEMHTLLLLKSHGGSLDRETIAKGPEQGIVLRHGDLHEPWISADSSKAVVIPLQ
jgi:hypothetical protein